MLWHTDADEHTLPPSRFRERVTWFDLWSFGTRCLQLAPLQTYATFLSPSLCVFCVCAHARALALSRSPLCLLFALLPLSSFYFQSLLGYSLFLLSTVVVFSRLPPNCSLRIHFVNKRRLLTFCVTVVLLCAAPRSLWGSTADLCECLVRPFFWAFVAFCFTWCHV